MAKPGDTKDPDKYIYSGYGLGFHITSEFTHPQGGTARNMIIFGVDSSKSVHATYKTQIILILGHGLTQKVNNSTIYAEKMYSPNFVQKMKHFVQVYIIIAMTVIYFLMAKKLLNLKPKILKLKQTHYL